MSAMGGKQTFAAAEPRDDYGREAYGQTWEPNSEEQ
jgi:hypothetical protein